MAPLLMDVDNSIEDIYQNSNCKSEPNWLIQHSKKICQRKKAKWCAHINNTACVSCHVKKSRWRLLPRKFAARRHGGIAKNTARVSCRQERTKLEIKLSKKIFQKRATSGVRIAKNTARVSCRQEKSCWRLSKKISSKKATSEKRIAKNTAYQAVVKKYFGLEIKPPQVIYKKGAGVHRPRIQRVSAFGRQEELSLAIAPRKFFQKGNISCAYSQEYMRTSCRQEKNRWRFASKKICCGAMVCAHSQEYMHQWIVKKEPLELDLSPLDLPKKATSGVRIAINYSACGHCRQEERTVEIGAQENLPKKGTAVCAY
ncbi:hypothetical protein AVEN_84115-1 [Araneus ventricosus]|uniref:Uncharacterized protein n=1 Tax=Araneus ventricosus TaxID=182803 RepID=A0A4Y2RWL3_ARAVE|nr:hypothetical protein AVEN_84115-1 [Araneus ventricosus]